MFSLRFVFSRCERTPHPQAVMRPVALHWEHHMGEEVLHPDGEPAGASEPRGRGEAGIWMCTECITMSTERSGSGRPSISLLRTLFHIYSTRLEAARRGQEGSNVFISPLSHMEHVITSIRTSLMSPKSLNYAKVLTSHGRQRIGAPLYFTLCAMAFMAAPDSSFIKAFTSVGVFRASPPIHHFYLL